MTHATAVHVAATASAPALLLRPWEERDIAPLIEVYRDPVMHRWTRIPVANHEDAVRWLEIQSQGWATGDRLSFAVLEQDRLVANVVIKRNAPTDPTGPSADVGYWTAATARGRGIAPRALEALTVWAFSTFADADLDHLRLLHQIDNPASCRVAEKTGYTYEKTLLPYPPFPKPGHLHTRHRGA
ncbi:GNAT family N-acetyltransferase [Streptomyces sp. NPDC058405]|uniref:GNAT family N-acetyltransferase n=1 Tax=unclassified Streptomyces TaxID=2593676 RepID=UPI00365DB1C9